MDAETKSLTVAALAAFGDSLGLSFQMLDDILDLTGDEAVTGKRRGAALRDIVFSWWEEEHLGG